MKSPVTGKTTCVLFEAGKAWDGYFTNEGVVDQFLNAFEICDDMRSVNDQEMGHVFDNAINHQKHRPNALSAMQMPVNPLEKNNPLCETKNCDGTSTKVPMDNG